MTRFHGAQMRALGYGFAASPMEAPKALSSIRRHPWASLGDGRKRSAQASPHVHRAKRLRKVISKGCGSALWRTGNGLDDLAVTQNFGRFALPVDDVVLRFVFCGVQGSAWDRFPGIEPHLESGKEIEHGIPLCREDTALLAPLNNGMNRSKGAPGA
jgi:hypothetical protein